MFYNHTIIHTDEQYLHLPRHATEVFYSHLNTEFMLQIHNSDLAWNPTENGYKLDRLDINMLLFEMT